MGSRTRGNTGALIWAPGGARSREGERDEQDGQCGEDGDSSGLHVMAACVGGHVYFLFTPIHRFK